MKLFPADQFIEAQAHQPQMERFMGNPIYVIESPEDYAQLPDDLMAIVEARQQARAEI